MARSAEDTVKAARELYDVKKYFDGVQLVNTALEEYEDRLKAEAQGLPPFEARDILKVPQAFLEKVMSSLSEVHKSDISKLFAVRAELLGRLQAANRGMVDIGAALLLKPGDAAYAKIKADLEEEIEGRRRAEGDRKTPVTIITGFLGAGKTTLMNHILQEQHGKRIGVIENEFGEVGIDDKLLKGRKSLTEENVIEMNNGCVCCTVREDLIAGLKKLHKQTTGKGNPLDGILIETTGLADPAPVAQTFFADDFVQANMALDGILTVVDAKHVLGHLREEKPEGVVNEAVEQVAFADRMLLNKTDLVSPDELEEVMGELRVINKTAALRRTQNSVVDMDFIIGIKAFSLDKVLMQVNADFLVAEEEHGHSHGGGGHIEGGHEHDGHDCGASCTDASHGHGGAGHGEGHGHGHEESSTKEGNGHVAHKNPRKPRHQHDYRVSSVGISVDREIHEEKLQTFISWLMQVKGPDLFRAKGVLAVKGQRDKFVFQAVHMQFGGSPQEPWKAGETRCCKMVFIGKNLNREELNKRFEECLV